MLRDKLEIEIKSYNELPPDVDIWVDNSALFWHTKGGHFVYMQEHRDIKGYLDNDHKLEEIRAKGEVGDQGVYWKNKDFENPFTLQDFLDKIETINI